MIFVSFSTPKCTTSESDNIPDSFVTHRFLRLGNDIDGHDVEAVAAAYADAAGAKGRPSVIIARTLKGKGVSFLENTNGHHGKPVDGDELERALSEIGEPEIGRN